MIKIADARKLTWTLDFKDEASQGIKKADNAMDKFAKKAKDIGGGMQKVGKSMTKWVTAPLVGIGAASVKTVASFDDGMSKVMSLIGSTGEAAEREMEQLREKAIELGQNTAYSASEASEGMQILAASGMNANDIMKTSSDMFTLMSAGGTDAETAASVLTNTMAQFNMTTDESQRIVDGFAQGAASAKLGVEDLEYIMGQAGGTLASMNMDMEQSVAMAGQLANAGTPIGTIGTTLNAMGREIKANAKEFKKFGSGIDVYDKASGKLKDMGTILGEVEQQLKGKTDAQRDEMLATVFSGQAMKGAQDWLSKGSDAYADLTEEIYGAAGAAEKMSKINESNIGGAFRSLKSSIETVMIRIGDVLVEPIQKVVEVITELTDKFSGLDEDTQKTIVALAGIAIAIGPVLKVGGKLLEGLGGIKGKISPFNLAIVAVVAGLMYLWKTSDKFRNAVKRMWHNLKTLAKIAAEEVQAFWKKHGDAIVRDLKWIWDKFTSFLEILVEGISDFVGIIASIFAGDWQGLKENLEGFWESIKDMFMLIFGWLIEKAKEIWNNIKNAIVESVQSTVEGVKQWYQDLKESIVNTFTSIKESAIEVWENIKTTLSEKFEAIKESWANLKQSLAENIQGKVDVIKDAFENAVSKIREAWSNLKTLLATTIKGKVEAITDAFHRGLDNVREKWEKLREFLRHPIQGTVSLVQRGADAVKRKVAGSHRTGKDRIPYNGYISELHKGEMVLPKATAERFRALGGSKDRVPQEVVAKEVSTRGNKVESISMNPTISITVEGNADEETVKDISKEVQRAVNQELNKVFTKLSLQGV